MNNTDAENTNKKKDNSEEGDGKNNENQGANEFRHKHGKILAVIEKFINASKNETKGGNRNKYM